MKNFIYLLRAERSKTYTDLAAMKEQIRVIYENNNLSDLQIEAQKLENHFNKIQEVIKSLQSICNHDWDDGTYETRYHYYTCKICGACKGDC